MSAEILHTPRVGVGQIWETFKRGKVHLVKTIGTTTAFLPVQQILADKYNPEGMHFSSRCHDLGWSLKSFVGWAEGCEVKPRPHNEPVTELDRVIWSKGKVAPRPQPTYFHTEQDILPTVCRAPSGATADQTRFRINRRISVGSVLKNLQTAELIRVDGMAHEQNFLEVTRGYGGTPVAPINYTDELAVTGFADSDSSEPEIKSSHVDVFRQAYAMSGGDLDNVDVVFRDTPAWDDAAFFNSGRNEYGRTPTDQRLFEQRKFDEAESDVVGRNEHCLTHGDMSGDTRRWKAENAIAVEVRAKYVEPKKSRRELINETFGIRE